MTMALKVKSNIKYLVLKSRCLPDEKYILFCNKMGYYRCYYSERGLPFYKTPHKGNWDHIKDDLYISNSYTNYKSFITDWFDVFLNMGPDEKY